MTEHVSREGGRGQEVARVCADLPVLPDPGEELFSSLLDEEEKPPPDVFSDLSTVLLSMDLGEGGTGTRTTGQRRMR